MPKYTDIKKVLVLGSGPIVIGQAAEFDYAGAQACRVLKKAGLNVVLVNSNPATIMTDSALADEIYLEPLTVTTLKRIIEKERPDSLLAGLGGQTGLTLAIQLNEDGFLDKMGVRLIGSNLTAIAKAEDRQLFKDTMAEIDQPTIPSEIANDIQTALKIAAEIGKSIKDTKEIIRSGIDSTHYTDFYRRYAEEDGESTAEDVAVDNTSNPEKLFFRQWQTDALFDAYENLDYRERMMVADHLGLCPECD